MTEEFRKGYLNGVEDALRFINTADLLPPKNGNGMGTIGVIAYEKRDKENTSFKDYEYFAPLGYMSDWLLNNFKYWKPVDKIHMTWLNI